MGFNFIRETGSDGQAIVRGRTRHLEDMVPIYPVSALLHDWMDGFRDLAKQMDLIYTEGSQEDILNDWQGWLRTLKTLYRDTCARFEKMGALIETLTDGRLRIDYDNFLEKPMGAVMTAKKDLTGIDLAFEVRSPKDQNGIILSLLDNTSHEQLNPLLQAIYEKQKAA